MFSQLYSRYERKGGHVPLGNVITAAVHHECDLFCAWYKTFMYQETNLSQKLSEHIHSAMTRLAHIPHTFYLKNRH